MHFRILICVFAVAVIAVEPNSLPAQSGAAPSRSDAAAPNPLAGRRLANYILGPGDEITIMSIYAPEIAKQPIRISTSGDINLTMVGRLRASGMSVEQLEEELRGRLKEFIKQPDVAISVTQFRSQPVYLIGAVGMPGEIQLEGVKTLLEVLSKAGGMRPDAGSRVIITRRLEWGPIPLPSAKTEGEFSKVEVGVRSIENAMRPEENIQILPYDVIQVPKAEMVYVIGDGVRQPGAFTLSDRKGISVIEAIARAQGTTNTAKKQGAMIIHPNPDGIREQIPLNLAEVLNGKTKDIILQPDDILYVPQSELKGTARKTLDAIVSMTTGLIIYRGF